ncbi:MAG: response regulator, partial [Pontibacter sp.]|nr:response regulator [Pontibacter sp.]
HITVLPPFWQSGWAYLLYACCVLSGLYAYRSVTLQRERVRNKQRLERLEAEKTHELDTMKLNFFANISHEFRTPLTLISDPIDRLVEEEDILGASERRGLHKLIQRNSRLLLRLINQLLDISEADAGMMQLKVVKWDVVQFCRAIANVFNYKANRNNIVYIFSSEVEAAEAYFDPDKLEKILYNLLSNAFKFTPEYGRIAVRLALVEDVKQLPPRLLQHAAVGGTYLKLDVEDDGVGISPEEQEKIFERFFQVVKNGYRKKGTGIGLTLVKQLVERHHGEVQVVSEPGKGTKFTVWLPVTAQQFSTEEFEFPTLHNSHLYDLRTGTDIELSETSISAEGEVTEESPLLLIVEDSLDVRRYLRFSFEKQYRVEEARNGAEGLEKAMTHMPDLIISDVLMPELSGLELCQRLKIHESTCHIPVILLTAQKAEHCQLMGLERGADDYVSKPFSMPLLKAKVKNLIASRKLLKRRFAEDLSFKPEQIATNSLDEKFMEQAMKVIELHLADSNFSPEVLAEELGMSRSQLYRKLKGLTGLSVSIFIRNTRLRQAAKLLQQKELTVAEVAYTTGFSDPAYFTKCFKEQYAKTPTDFMQKV